ncbi:putative surface protein with fasciclin (FAS1) repeats [Chitinophaga polysaccharea]|uniref:Putative surface protein with fasciclin (FAS1) repeats n=1 Tax=Chitinophaga polysaccharea TaxID=1293035 RepID=A0A561PP98_9BACT|nr:fasciclin domain-containing protein [Chitinophaga polysaccharea]TWF39928.1 putative surface protein with fasciclin (FAS1) repeats [Chitinophaga polysaccharea]
MKYNRNFLWRWLLAGTLLFTACSKDKVQPENRYAKNGIAAVVNSNFSLSLFKYALVATAYSDTLSMPGPYTLLGPSNDALIAAGLSTGAAVMRAVDSIKGMIPYHVIRGNVRLDSLPLAFNQTFATLTGQPVYVTRWINPRDTAVVVNGVRVSTRDKSAANGFVNVCDGLLSPITYSNVQQAVSGDPALSLFNAAIIQSGLASTYQSGGPYTVFAPVNAAFQAIGIPTTDSVYNMDPVKLQAIVKAHITKGRNFVYDYILKANVTTNSYTEQMLDGTTTNITLVRDATQPGRFAGINIQGAAMATLSRKNVIAGNGVVHNISSILTQ